MQRRRTGTQYRDLVPVVRDGINKREYDFVRCPDRNVSRSDDDIVGVAKLTVQSRTRQTDTVQRTRINLLIRAESDSQRGWSRYKITPIQNRLAEFRNNLFDLKLLCRNNQAVNHRPPIVILNPQRQLPVVHHHGECLDGEFASRRTKRLPQLPFQEQVHAFPCFPGVSRCHRDIVHARGHVHRERSIQSGVEILCQRHRIAARAFVSANDDAAEPSVPGRRVVAIISRHTDVTRFHHRSTRPEVERGLFAGGGKLDDILLDVDVDPLRREKCLVLKRLHRDCNRTMIPSARRLPSSS